MSKQILPFYLVCDESYSMEGDPLQAINTALPEMHQAIGGHPGVADKAHFGIIAFHNDAEVLLPLSDLGDVDSMPVLEAKGSTSYKAAFRLLRETITQDVDRCKREGHLVYRPSVFFLSDGHPNGEDWEVDYRKLVDPGWNLHPNILAFGFGQADTQVVGQVATVAGFIADGTLGPAEALQEFAASLTKSIILSGSGAASVPSRAPTIHMPDQVNGFTAVPADQL